MKISKPPSIKKKLSNKFNLAFDLVEKEEKEVVTGIVTKIVYTPKNLDRGNNTGPSIVADWKFITELVEMDFSKEDAQHDFRVLFQKVNNKMLICNTTPDNLDAICFVKINEDFKVSNFGHIFSETGFSKKAEHPEFLEVKLLFRCTLAIRQSEWKLLHDRVIVCI